MAPVVPRKTVIRDLIPWRSRRDEGVELRLDTGLAVERAEADRHFFALRPLGAEQAGAADRTEGLHAPVVRPEDADELLTVKQPEPVARDAPLCSAEGTGVLSAPRAVAVIGPAKRRRHLEANAAAEARTMKRIVGARLCGHVRPTVQEPTGDRSPARQARSAVNGDGYRERWPRRSRPTTQHGAHRRHQYRRTWPSIRCRRRWTSSAGHRCSALRECGRSSR